MDTEIVTDFLPESVRRLDARLNARILAARSVRTLNARLRDKLTIKRRLVRVPFRDLDAAARDALGRLDLGARR